MTPSGNQAPAFAVLHSLLRSGEEVMVKHHAPFGVTAGSLTRSTAQTSSAA